MKKPYGNFEAKVLLLDAEDVITTSAEFQDASTGDNGVWFPGQKPGGGEEAWT